MEQETVILKRNIKLNPVKVEYTSGNNIPYSFVIKREATVREALHICRNILGFDIELAIGEVDSAEEANDIRKDITKHFNDFLRGKCDWPYLCEACYVYDDIECVSVPAFIWMVSYCQQKGIL